MPTIVVIDDDPDVRRALKDRFTAKGFRCLTAANGAVGIQLIALHRPDLVICDFEMPVMNGLEVLKRLRHALDFQNMPFVLMTGNKNIYRLLANARLEVEGLVKKPFQLELCSHVLRPICGDGSSDSTETARGLDMNKSKSHKFYTSRD